MPFQRAKSSNPLSLFGDKIGRWMGKVLPPILPAPGALPAGSGKRLPGPDGRVNLSGAQGGNPFKSKFIHLLKSEGGHAGKIP